MREQVAQPETVSGCEGRDSTATPTIGFAWFMTFCLMFGAMYGSATAAEESHGRCFTEPWMKEPRAFVAEVTGSLLPHVCIRIVRRHHVEDVIRSAVQGTAEVAAAAFVHGTGEILLADDLDFGDAVARSYLVHELVHLQQHVTGSARKAKCIGLVEGEAYSIQARYLRRHERRNEAFLFQVLGMLQSACEIDY